jgi:hypothetical protein
MKPSSEWVGIMPAGRTIEADPPSVSTSLVNSAQSAAEGAALAVPGGVGVRY